MRIGQEDFVLPIVSRSLRGSTSAASTIIMLTSLPIEQPQPNQEFYGLDLLNLFETYTRAQFETAGGPLIPFDPTRPEQDWWDDTYAAITPTQSVSYYAVVSGAGGTAAIGSFTQ